MVAHLLWEQEVAGSNPVSPTGAQKFGGGVRHERQRSGSCPASPPHACRLWLRSEDRSAATLFTTTHGSAVAAPP